MIDLSRYRNESDEDSDVIGVGVRRRVRVAYDGFSTSEDESVASASGPSKNHIKRNSKSDQNTSSKIYGSGDSNVFEVSSGDELNPSDESFKENSSKKKTLHRVKKRTISISDDEEPDQGSKRGRNNVSNSEDELTAQRAPSRGSGSLTLLPAGVKDPKAFNILRSRNPLVPDAQLIEVLEESKWDYVKAERTIKQRKVQATMKNMIQASPKKLSPTKSNTSKFAGFISTLNKPDKKFVAGNHKVPLVQSSTATSSTALPKSNPYFSIFETDDEDTPKAVASTTNASRFQFPKSNLFSKPSTISVPTDRSAPLPKVIRKPPKEKKPRQKRRFMVTDLQSGDEEEDDDDDSFINDDSEDEEVVLSDDDDVDERAIRRSRRAKRKMNTTETDELADFLDADDDDYQEQEELFLSDDEFEEKTKKKKEKTKKEKIPSNRSKILKEKVWSFINESSQQELETITGVSAKKAELIMSLRPYKSFEHALDKFDETKGLSDEILSNTLEAIKTREVIENLMAECEKLSSKISSTVKDVLPIKQPLILNSNCQLKEYQLVGLNWLHLMWRNKINAILADEMGLGKTVQIIALLALLKEKHQNRGPHLIVVPASTLDNWDRELSHWCPKLDVLVYHGTQADRAAIREEVIYGIDGKRTAFEVILTTYNMVFSEEDMKKFFRKFTFQVAVFDEAHLLKNMKTARYERLIRMNALRRILLTGTPLQNNLLELMSLLIFTVPQLFHGKTQDVKSMFTFNNFRGCSGRGDSKKDDGSQPNSRSSSPSPPGSQSQDDNSSSSTMSKKTSFEKSRIEHAKRIMNPFILRRLKSEVLKDLPKKEVVITKCSMSAEQEKRYRKLVTSYRKDVNMNESIIEEIKQDDINEVIANLKMDKGTPKALKPKAGASMLMNLRLGANHPLLLRVIYTDSKLRQMSKLMLQEETHKDANVNFIFEDMQLMSDFELHNHCRFYPTQAKFALTDAEILGSGKFEVMDDILPDLKKRNKKVLIFSQFKMMLDIIEVYMNIRMYKFLRLDGSTRIDERLDLIDEFNSPESGVFAFLLTTRAGGVGVNLTAATTAIIHDIDFNPYNDKQAEDRCHRLGQTENVTIYKLITSESIEEGILSIQEDKLRLGEDIVSNDSTRGNLDRKDVKTLLLQALKV